MTRVLDYLLDLPQISFTKYSVAKEQKLDWKTTDRAFKKLLKFGVIRKTQGGYLLNEGSKVFRSIWEADFQMSSMVANETAAKYMRKQGEKKK